MKLDIKIFIAVGKLLWQKKIRMLSSMAGFTLIELLVVVSIMAMLMVVGLASLASYGNGQALQAAGANVVSMLQTARSRSLAQVKTSACALSSLQGYNVTFSLSQSTYTLNITCNNTDHAVQSANLTSNLSFMGGSSSKIAFNVLDGTATPGKVTIFSSVTKTSKVITVDGVGNIQFETAVVPTVTPTLMATPTFTPTPTNTPIPTPTLGPIALDATSLNYANSVTSISWNHTTGTHTNTVMLVSISTFGTYGASVISVKYNGVNLTRLSFVDCAGSSCRNEVWYLAPGSVPTGTHTVAIQLSTSLQIVTGAATFYNVNSSNPFGAVATSTGSSSPATITISSNTGSLVFASFSNGGASWTTGSGQTELWNSNAVDEGAASTESGSSGSTSMRWTNGSGPWSEIGFSLNQ